MKELKKLEENKEISKYINALNEKGFRVIVKENKKLEEYKKVKPTNQ